MFTEKDKVVFQKLNEISQKQQGYQEELSKIDESKTTLLECFEQIDSEVAKMSENFFEKFKEQFELLYDKFENYYEVDARLKKGIQGENT